MPVVAHWEADGQLVLDELPQGTVELDVEWLLQDGYGEQRWSAVAPAARVGAVLPLDLGARMRADEGATVSVGVILEAVGSEGGALGRLVLPSHVVQAQSGQLLDVAPVVKTADEVARYAPPGFTGSLSGGGVPSRTGIAPRPVEVEDWSDREEDLPGVVVTHNNVDLEVATEPATDEGVAP